MSVAERSPREAMIINHRAELWTGRDFHTAESALLIPGKSTRVPCEFGKNNLPSLKGIADSDLFTTFHMLFPSMRSRFAQIGTEPDSSLPLQLAADILHSDVRNNDGTIGKSFISEYVLFSNHATRELEIPKGTNICRLVSDQTGASERGEELKQLVKDKAISVDGTYGIDWFWHYRKGNSQKDSDIDGVYLKVNQEKLLWIPPDKNNPRIRGSNKKNFRDDIDQLLTPLQDDLEAEKVCVISETPHIKLGKYDLVLSTTVFERINPSIIINPELQAIPETDARHLLSQYLEGVRTNWPIRLELLTTREAIHHPEYVLAKAFKR